MRIGGSLFLIAVGAILEWAITDHVNNVNLATVGTILMVAGAVGLVSTLTMLLLRRRPEVVHESRRRYVDGARSPVPRAPPT
jgi:hypothetical protein